MPRAQRLLIVAALLTAGLGVVLPPERAAASQVLAPTSLGIGSFSDIVVDQAHGRVFISDGASQVLVRGLDGSAATSIGGLANPAGMTLSADGSRLYVAVSDARIVVVDPTSLATTSLAMPGACPGDVAEASGVLWVANGCNTWGTIDAVNPATGAVTAGVRTNTYNPQVYASPAAPDRLFWFEAGLSPSRTRLERTTGGPTPSLTPVGVAEVGSNQKDAAVSPDGTRVVTASGAPYNHPAYSTTDMSPLGAYTSTSYPVAVAFRQDGLLAAGSTSGVYLHAPGSMTTPVQRRFLEPGADLADHGLAFGQTLLYAVSETHESGRYTYVLHVEDPAGLDAPQVTVSGSDYDNNIFRYDENIKLSVSLTAASVERQVRVYATSARGQRRLLVSGPVAAGSSVFRAKVRLRENSALTAEVTQGALVSSASEAVAVRVLAKITQRALRPSGRSGAYALYRVGKRAYIKGKVLPSRAGRRNVTWQVEYEAYGRWKRLGKGKRLRLDRTSSAYVFFGGQSYLRGVRFRVRLVWLGDRTNPRTDGDWTYLRYR